MGRFAFFTTSSATWSGSNNTPSLPVTTVTQSFIYSSTLPSFGGRVERAISSATASITTTIGGTVTLEVPLSFSTTLSISSQNGGGVYIGWMGVPSIANSRRLRARACRPRSGADAGEAGGSRRSRAGFHARGPQRAEAQPGCGARQAASGAGLLPRLLVTRLHPAVCRAEDAAEAR